MANHDKDTLGEAARRKYFYLQEDHLQSRSCPRVPAVGLFQYVEVCLCAYENEGLHRLCQDHWVGQCIFIEYPMSREQHCKRGAYFGHQFCTIHASNACSG